MRRYATLGGRRFLTHRKSYGGLSFVEFLGCLAAVAGGVAFGSMYLGIDMKTMAIGVLEKAELIEPGQFGTGTDNTPVYSQIDLASTAEAVLAGKAAPDDVESETTDNNATVADDDFVVQLTEEQRAALTRNYWGKSVEAMQQESTNRLSAMASNPNWQLFDYLTHCQNGHQRAADSIEALSKHGIDAKVQGYAEKALRWHLSGVKLHSRAIQLLNEAPTSDLSGPLAQSWQSARTQHRMEEKLLITRYQAVARYMRHTFDQAQP